METLNECPDAASLEALAMGRMAPAEVEDLAAHCENCEQCIRWLERIAIADPLIASLKAGAQTAKTPLPTAVQDLMAQLTLLHAGSTSDANGPAPDTTIDEELCDFLAPSDSPDELGKLGDYRVLKLLGAGGMGVVFLAEESVLGRQVALKVMRPALAASATARKRFLREARAMAAVQHDHIIHINQIGEAGAIPFLAMPYLQGETLENRLDRQSPMPLPEVLRIGREVAEGLSAAHRLRLIHRDIKPGNIWLEGERGRVKILDFGLVRSTASDDPLTFHGAIAGTPAYMSPEQARGDTVDARTDLFSLGCVLYRMSTGRLPFHGRDTRQLLYAVEHAKPADPTQIAPNLPRPLSSLILHLLSKRPEERPAAAEDVVVLLGDLESADDRPANSRSTSPAAQKSAGRVGFLVAVLLLAVLPLSYLFGGAVIRFARNQGELVIQTDSPEVEVTIRGGKAIIHDHVKDRRFVLTPGEYDVEVVEEGETGARYATKKLIITRGGQETFRAEFIPAKRDEHRPEIKSEPPSVDPPDADAPDRRATAYVLSIGGRIRGTVQGQQRDIESLEALPAVPFSLTWAFLHGNQKLTDEGLAAFAGCQHLQVLFANGTRVGDAGLAHFKDCRDLRELSLNDTRVTDQGIEHFRGLKQLERLCLDRTRITDKGLACFRGQTKLTTLSLLRTDVTDAGLANFDGCQQLIYLDLAATAVTDAGLRYFKGSKYLTYLHLGDTGITDAGIAVFADCQDLEFLLLYDMRLTDAGLTHFADCTKLIELTLGNTPVGDASLRPFLACKRLRTLHLTDTKVSPALVEEFQKALPDCRVIYEVTAR